MARRLDFSDEDGRLDELDRLLNDPEVPMEASRVWDLLDELSAPAQAGAAGGVTQA